MVRVRNTTNADVASTTQPPVENGNGGKRVGEQPDVGSSGIHLSIDGKISTAAPGELLLAAILREKEVPHVCYHSSLMGPIRTCDTCLVEVDGKLQRACGMPVVMGMEVITDSDRAKNA